MSDVPPTTSDAEGGGATGTDTRVSTATAGPDAIPATEPVGEPSPARLTLKQKRRAALVERVAYTDRQRRAMVLVLALVLGVLLWRVARDRAYVSDPQPIKPARFDDLADRLDPNTAPWEELVALPTLGEKRAKAIVEYRDDWRTRHPNEPAFKTLIDLAGVKGIGASTLENIGPHVTFPEHIPERGEAAARAGMTTATRSATKRNP